jgi:hypothetical protein
MVYFWYPADAKGKTVKASPYLPGAAAINKLPDRALVEGDGKLWPAILSGQIDSHALEGAPVASNGSRFPVLIFSHGLGSPVFHYTAFIEGLVSHGYVVASIEHTYEVNAIAFPDGRVIALSPISWGVCGPQPPQISEEEASKKAVAWERKGTVSGLPIFALCWIKPKSSIGIRARCSPANWTWRTWERLVTRLADVRSGAPANWRGASLRV